MRRLISDDYMLPSGMVVDMSIASLIVGFASSATYGVIQWFRHSQRKRRVESI
jgi:hypothetical protein